MQFTASCDNTITMTPENQQRVEGLQQIIAIAMVVLMLVGFFVKVIFV